MSQASALCRWDKHGKVTMDGKQNGPAQMDEVRAIQCPFKKNILRFRMKKTLLAVLLFATVLVASPAPHNAFTPDTVPYGPVPAFIPAGAQLAVVEGDPMASSGDYTIRLKMPDGYKIPPHWHPKRENVTVISGTLKFGMGNKFDESKMSPFPAGSFAYLDPDMHHYVMAKGETVVQVHGMSPVQFNYIDPKDDPSKK